MTRLTDQVWVEPQNRQLASEHVDLLDEDPQAGDMKVYPREDAAGRQARRGGNTNYGFSGNIGVSVFDGGSWRRFFTRDCLEYQTIHYERAMDQRDAAIRTAIELKRLQGRTVSMRVPEGKVQRIMMLD